MNMKKEEVVDRLLLQGGGQTAVAGRWTAWRPN
jgi:hypothetical protein